MSKFVSYNKEKVILNNKVLHDKEFIMKNDGDKFIVENLKDGTINIAYKVDDDLLNKVLKIPEHKTPLMKRLEDINISLQKKESHHSKKGRKKNVTKKTKKTKKVGEQKKKRTNTKKRKRKKNVTKKTKKRI